MFGQIKVKCDKCGHTTNIPYLKKPDEFVRGCDILEALLSRAGDDLNIGVDSDGQWWVWDEELEGYATGATIAELISKLGEREPI